jgi:hypothetical protein
MYHDLGVDSFVTTSGSVICCQCLCIPLSSSYLPVQIIQSLVHVLCRMLTQTCPYAVMQHTEISNSICRHTLRQQFNIPNEDPPPILCSTVFYSSHSCSTRLQKYSGYSAVSVDDIRPHSCVRPNVDASFDGLRFLGQSINFVPYDMY